MQGQLTALVKQDDAPPLKKTPPRFKQLKHMIGNTPLLAIRFALNRAEIATALVGISSVEQVEAAVQAAAAGPLPGDVVERIVQTTVGTA